jgi:DNA polymerase-1
MPIQWTSADIIKIAMIKSSDFIEKNNLKSKMIMQVHDELVFDVYPWEEDIIKKEITSIMENIISDKDIILKSDIWEWSNWRDAK